MTQLSSYTFILEFTTEKARDAFEKKLHLPERPADSTGDLLDVNVMPMMLMDAKLMRPHPGLFASGITGVMNHPLRFISAKDIINHMRELAGPKLNWIRIYSVEPVCRDTCAPHTYRAQWNKGDTLYKMSALPSVFIEGMRYCDHIQFANSTPKAVMDHHIDQAFDDIRYATIEYNEL